MITSIAVYNRFFMDLVSLGLREIPYRYWNLISISCPNTSKLENNKTILVLKNKGCNKILELQFDDVRNADIPILGRNNFVKSTIFSKDQALEIIKFVDNVSIDKVDSALVIHCDAGVSRSGAIAIFVSKYLNIPFFDDNIKPNKYVLDLLVEVSNEQK